jgi:hypothetical protein
MSTGLHKLLAAINLLQPEQSTNTVYLPYVSNANAAATIIQHAYTKYINHQHVTTNDVIENTPTLSILPLHSISLKNHLPSSFPTSLARKTIMRNFQDNSAILIAQLDKNITKLQA